MQKYVEKAKRLRAPKFISVAMRSEVYDFFCSESDRLQTGVAVLIRGILEDFYDFYDKNHAASSEEVQT